jgi:2'-hydroxyisoflavone reductase
MRILVLGGTVFLGRTIAEQAVARGHDVVCAARGTAQHGPEGTRWIRWDRDEEPPAELTAVAPDAVVDVARLPSHVRRAVAAFPDAHWSFVSTCNVYADEGAGGTAASDLKEPIADDVDPSSSPDAYGAMKVACEQIVRDGVRAAFVVRPGLVVGPWDPSGRFAYWPVHAAAAAHDHRPLLVPGEPLDPVQVIDVRDLAAWILDAAEAGATGSFDGNAAPFSRQTFVDALAEGVGAEIATRWVSTGRLVEAGVREWSGPGSVPVWIGEPGYERFMARDVSASLAAGLRTRPLADTVRDTLAWTRTQPNAAITGLTRHEEIELLARLAPRT